MKTKKKNVESINYAVTKMDYGARQKTTQTITTTESAHRGLRYDRGPFLLSLPSKAAQPGSRSQPFHREQNILGMSKSATMPPFILKTMSIRCH
jgi:hypothetical protein